MTSAAVSFGSDRRQASGESALTIQAGAVLHQSVTEKGELRLHARALAVEPGVRAPRGSVRLVRALLALEVDLAVAPGTGRQLLAGTVAQGLKLFIDAQASISVPSTEKCSVDKSLFTRGCSTTSGEGFGRNQALGRGGPGSSRIPSRPIPHRRWQVRRTTETEGRCRAAPSIAARSAPSRKLAKAWRAADVQAGSKGGQVSEYRAAKSGANVRQSLVHDRPEPRAADDRAEPAPCQKIDIAETASRLIVNAAHSIHPLAELEEITDRASEGRVFQQPARA